MNRFSFPTLLFSLALLPSSGRTAPLEIDLDKPGALQVVQQERPEEYAKVIGILRSAESLPQSQVAGWVRTEYRADAVQFTAMLLASAPPKRRLSFTLGETSYTATVTVPATTAPTNAK